MYGYADNKFLCSGLYKPLCTCASSYTHEELLVTHKINNYVDSAA